MGDLLDTIFATVYASAVSTVHISTALAKQKQKRLQQEQQQAWNQSHTSTELKEEDDWETAMHRMLSAEIDSMRISEYFNFNPELTTSSEG